MPEEPWAPAISLKQRRFLDLCHRQPGAKSYILISGPRKSTKTTACLHAIAEHLWDVPNARFACFTPTVGTADSEGFWTELCEKIIPQWIAGGFGMEWVKHPTQDGVTKKKSFEIRNRHKGISRCNLDSLQYEKDAEDKFKNKNYSGIYISELSYYKLRSTFDTWRQALRGQGLEEWMLVLIADTNPAPEGKNSWIWKLWFDERLREPDAEEFRLWQNKLGLMEFTVADNIFRDAQWHREQSEAYRWSEDLHKRYYLGEWVTAATNSIFYEVFRPMAHVLGEFETAVNEDPEILLPDENCTELITGWDLGDVNHAMMILHKRWMTVMMRDGRPRDVSIFDFIDEVVDIKAERPIEEFIEESMEKVAFWEEFIGRAVNWRNWSDNSAWFQRSGRSNNYHHVLVRDISGGKIVLQAADKSPGSVRKRVEFMKRLFFQERVFICRSRCPNFIESCQGLPPGKGGNAIKKDSHFKHAFDAGTYPIVSECYDELLTSTNHPNVGRQDGLVLVPA